MIEIVHYGFIQYREIHTCFVFFVLFNRCLSLSLFLAIRFFLLIGFLGVVWSAGVGWSWSCINLGLYNIFNWSWLCQLLLLLLIPSFQSPLPQIIKEAVVSFSYLNCGYFSHVAKIFQDFFDYHVGHCVLVLVVGFFNLNFGAFTLFRST